jgi:peptide chain release factor 2
MSSSEFWNDKNKVKKIMSELDELKNVCCFWEKINKEVKDLYDLEDIAILENDSLMLNDVECSFNKIIEEIELFKSKIQFDKKHDIKNAIISIHAGAGGIESCDWAQMLTRMYSKWAYNKNFVVEIISNFSCYEIGIKSISMLIKGKYAYGFLKSEIGVHRLVRISPFDSNKRRHTSFCSVDVIPEIDDNININIEDKDIRIDTYRASGAGGQHVNKTDSAVRITHIVTGIVVQSQNGRSQTKNKETAMKLLKSKLYEFEMEKKRSFNEKHYNEKGFIEWGNQIRSYVFMPYQLVKDHRTGYKTSKINFVMDGDIDGFINSYLLFKLNNKII